MNSIDKLAAELQKAIANGDSGKKKGYDTQAEVTRLDGDTVWVKIAGGDDETPVSRTNNANIGDNVLVRISGGRAWLLGNQTSPATDDTVANEANHQAYEALGMAASAGQSAELARTAADVAAQSAERAQESADRSENLLSQMEQAAEDADTTLVAIYQDAKRANDNADAAQASADETKNYAYMAMSQLGIVEDVVGVLELVAQNAEYQVTADTEVIPDKWYFTRSGTAPDYTYSIVNNPTGNPSTEGWYEITNIDDAIKNYVSSHLVLTEEGLWIQHSTSSTKVLLSPSDGLVIYNYQNQPIAQYGEEAIIGKQDGFNIKIGGENNEIGFYQGSNRIAYLNGNELYVQNSLSFGSTPYATFSFYQRANGHFTLKIVERQ